MKKNLILFVPLALLAATGCQSMRTQWGEPAPRTSNWEADAEYLSASEYLDHTTVSSNIASYSF